ncbi:MAG: hypothetical protein J6Q17_00760 [Clostridia bacterium]|nr:hypothetical protein [Clostridia bacterium]
MKHARLLRFTILLLAAMTALFLAVSVSAADKSISLNKTEFAQNDDILVTAVGEGTDWVGLYLRGETPGQSACIFWYYVEQDADPGDAVDIRETRTNGQTEYEEIPPGEYTMWLLLNDGYEPFDSVDFTVVATLELDQYSYQEGEDIFVTANGSGKDWVGLYRKGEVPGSGVSSIYWYYVAEGHTPLEPVSIKGEVHNADRDDVADLPAGEYTMFLLANDGYDVIDSIDFKITGSKKAEEPTKTEEPAPAKDPAPAAEEAAPDPVEEPAADAEPEAAPQETPTASDGGTAGEPAAAKSGCGSLIGGGYTVLAAILCSAWIVKRKH